MVQSEEEVLKAAQAILEQKQYQKLRNYIYVSVACTLSPPLSLDPHGATFRGRKEGRKETLQTQTGAMHIVQADVTLSVRFCTTSQTRPPVAVLRLGPDSPTSYLPSFVPEKVTVCTATGESLSRCMG